MINNFLKAVGADPRPSNNNNAPTTNVSQVTATAIDVTENLAHAIGGWLNFQEGKTYLKGTGSLGGRYYYEDKLVREKFEYVELIGAGGFHFFGFHELF
jgi:hypothetical protein